MEFVEVEVKPDLGDRFECCDVRERVFQLSLRRKILVQKVKIVEVLGCSEVRNWGNGSSRRLRDVDGGWRERSRSRGRSLGDMDGGWREQRRRSRSSSLLGNSDCCL